MKYLLFLVTILLPNIIYSQRQDTSQLKRAPHKVILAVDKNNFYEENIRETPYVLPDNTIQLYPGETVYIEIEKVGSLIKSMRAVRQIADSSKTMIISFTQTSNNKVHELMMLKLTNPFNSKLSYTAIIYLFEHKKWVDTNVLPIQAGLAAFETWPDIITSIAIGEWKLEPK